MAIDEVDLYQGECPPINVDGSLCDFEASSNCQLEFDLTSDYFWKVQRGPTTNQATGPSVDHTLGTAIGQFVFELYILMYHIYICVYCVHYADLVLISRFCFANKVYFRKKVQLNSVE